MERCFIIQPFDNDRFDRRFDETFSPAIQEAGFEPYRVDRDAGASIPIDRIASGIREARACFADITLDNPNVWFEVGFALALDKDMCLVCAEERRTGFPFDIQHRRITRYKTGSPSDFETLGKEITLRLKAIAQTEERIRHATELQSVTQTAGLTGHEIAALSVTMAQTAFTGGWVAGWVIQRDLERAGFTPLATALGLEKLSRIGHLGMKYEDDQNGERMTLYSPTDSGKDWLLHHQDDLQLKRKSARSAAQSYDDIPSEDDIPF